MNKLKFLLLFILTAMFTEIVSAEDFFSLSTGIGIIISPYKNYNRNFYLIPIIYYEDSNFWFHGLSGGYYLWNDQLDQLSLMIYYDVTRFKPINSDIYHLYQLDKRRNSVMTGFSYIHNTKYGFLRTKLARDILNNSNGFVLDLAWLYNYINNNLNITTNTGIIYNSKNYNNYYYGLSYKESRCNGLKYYNVDSCWNPYFELTTSYRFIIDWQIYATMRFNHINDKIRNSPIVNKSWNSLFLTGITYTF